MEDQKPKTRDQMLAFVTQQRVIEFKQLFEVSAKLFGGESEPSQKAIDAHLTEFAWADGLMADALLAQQANQVPTTGTQIKERGEALNQDPQTMTLPRPGDMIPPPDLTTKILPANPGIADIWRAKAEAPPGPGVQALMNLIAKDRVETITKHIDGNTMIQATHIKDADRIAQIAREAGFDTDFGEITAPFAMVNGDPMDVTKQVEALIRIVVEQCAKVAEGFQDPCTGKAIAGEIREHFSKEG